MKKSYFALLISCLCMSIVNAAPHSAVVEQMMARMSDEEKAAQLIIVYYTTPQFIIKHNFGGVLIMQNMLKQPAKLKAELEQIQDQAKTGILVSIDQEGGEVNRMKRLPGWKHVASAAEMGHWPNDRISAYAAKMAVVLEDIGINVNLAPVLDPSLDYMGKRAFMQKRSFGEKNDLIVDKAGAYINGFKSHGIYSVSKHFPGYDVHTNSDKEVAISLAPLANVQKNIQPFKRLSSEVVGVMISSIHYQKLTDAPAVMSKEMVKLARETHPDAILMTDDLWGTALRSWVKRQGNNTKDKQVLALTRGALDAGNDMLMITYPEKAVLMKHAISRWMNEDPAFRKRIEDSVFQILSNKQKIGLLSSVKYVQNPVAQRSE